MTKRSCGSAALVAALACLGPPAVSPASAAERAKTAVSVSSQQVVHVRKEINLLTPAEVEAFRKGVERMKQRPVDDPTSWIYQANIHGYPTLLNPGPCDVTLGPPREAWGTCQHRQFFFLPWHRMYLHFFDRILRAAVREALGDPNYEFALPYWDYGNPQNRDLPEPLRVPALPSNSLFVAERDPRCNAGLQCVTAAQASSAVALARVPFCNCPSGTSCDGCQPNLLPGETFGGQFTAVPQHIGNGTGQLEAQPHNPVHVAVGGTVGWMAWVNCSARDPVFWLHHANVDRLWQVWLNQNGGRANPLESDPWRDQVFTFFDENQQRVTLTGCQILDMLAQLDYQYEGLPVENVPLCGELSTQAPATTPAAASAFVPLATSGLKETHLGNEPVTVTIPLTAAANERILSVADSQSGTLLLLVEGVGLEHPGAVFEVYLDLPTGGEADPASSHFIGNLAVFGEPHHEIEESRSFDISEQVSALRAEGLWKDDVLAVTFVRGNPQQDTRNEPESFLRVRQVSVLER